MDHSGVIQARAKMAVEAAKRNRVKAAYEYERAVAHAVDLGISDGKIAQWAGVTEAAIRMHKKRRGLN